MTAKWVRGFAERMCWYGRGPHESYPDRSVGEGEREREGEGERKRERARKRASERASERDCVCVSEREISMPGNGQILSRA